MAFIDANGQKLFYNQKGQGPAVILVHGFPLDGRMWDAQVEGLSGRYRVIAPDLRGFGQSGRTQPFSLEDLADDLHGLAEKLGALPLVLGGLSMGGYIALAYVTRYAADLKALMLIDTKAEADTTEAKSDRMKMIETCRAGGAKAIADALLPKLVAQSSGAHVVARAREIMEYCPPATIENALLAMRDRRDYRCELPSIAVPTLVMAGREDALTGPSTAEAMLRELRHGQLAIIPDAGHLSPMEQPEKVNQEIRAFLGEVG